MNRGLGEPTEGKATVGVSCRCLMTRGYHDSDISIVNSKSIESIRTDICTVAG